MVLRTVLAVCLILLIGCKKEPASAPPPAPKVVVALPVAKPAEPEPPGNPGCPDKPEVRFYLWAWNAQMGLIHATGGKQAVPDSLMCKRGVNLKLVREDSTDVMAASMLAFAEAQKKGEANPAEGAHFIGIMGDGAAMFLKGLNDRLKVLGPEYVAAIVGSAGYSRGEDKFMGPAGWKADPKSARGGLVAGVLRDGDWNIAMKWLGDNGIPNNPDETLYDPEALNWVAASDYIDAAQKYVSGYCTELKNVKSGQPEKKCVNAVVTWTPGDVTVASKKGGLVNIASTREYATQMPHVIIGNKKWMAANRALVTSMLAAAFEGAERVKGSEEALRRAADQSALVYREQDGNYWYKYFRVQNEKDVLGGSVELGGSAVNNLADNQHLFGLKPGTKNLFAVTYTAFGDVVKSQYPLLLPAFYPAEEVFDRTYLDEVAKLVIEGPAK